MIAFVSSDHLDRSIAYTLTSPVQRLPSLAKTWSWTKVDTVRWRPNRPRCNRQFRHERGPLSTDGCISCTRGASHAFRQQQSLFFASCCRSPAPQLDAALSPHEATACPKSSIRSFPSALTQNRLETGNIAPNGFDLTWPRHLPSALLHPEVECLPGQFLQLRLEFLITLCPQFSCVHQIAVLLTNAVCTGNFAAANRKASRAKSSSTPCIS